MTTTTITKHDSMKNFLNVYKAKEHALIIGNRGSSIHMHTQGRKRENLLEVLMDHMEREDCMGQEHHWVVHNHTASDEV